MRLPWIQVATEVLEADAAELAIRLDVSEDTALACLVRLFHGMLVRADEKKPPSASDTIHGTGTVPARILSETARFSGDPGTFSEALQALVRPVVEVVEGGLRVRGMDRYDAAWGKNRPREWAEWKRKHRKPNGSDPKPGRNRDGTGSEPTRNRAETTPEEGRGSNGAGANPVLDRLKTGPQDADADADADAFLPPPPNPPPLRLVVPSTLEEEGLYRDLEPEESRWTTEEPFMRAWRDRREANGLSPGGNPTRSQSTRIKALIALYLPSQLTGAMDRYLQTKDPKAHFTDTYPLGVFLTPGVLEERIRPPAPRRLICCVCREACSSSSTSPTGRPLCAPHWQEWHDAFGVEHPEPEHQWFSTFRNPELSQEECAQLNEEVRAQELAVQAERQRQAPLHFRRWLQTREGRDTAAG